MPRSEKLNEQMRTQSRAQILAAASRLFAEQGYFKAKVSDIARAAGMSHGNVYWYFSSNEQSLKAILADGFESFEALFAESEALSGDAGEILEQLVKRYIELARERPYFFTINASLLGHGGAPFLKELGFDTVEIGRRYHQYLASIFRRVQSAAPDSRLSQIEAGFLPVLFFSFFNGLWLTYRDWEDLPLDVVGEAALRAVGYDCPAVD
jgi:AcrR family transcriptional regulator